MHVSAILQYLFYFVAIILHASYAVVVGVLTHKGLLVKFDGNHFLIVLGALGALLLMVLLIFTLLQHWRTDRFAIPSAQLGLILLFMLNELFYAIVVFSGNRHLDCEVDASGTPSPCVFRPLIFGLVFSACIILILYFVSMLLGRLVCPGFMFLSDPRVDDVEMSRIPPRERRVPQVDITRQPEPGYASSFSSRGHGRTSRKHAVPHPLDLTRSPNKPILVDVPLSATREEYQ